MASDSDPEAGVFSQFFCKIGMHNYAYTKQQYGDITVTEKSCMNCSDTEIEKPTPQR
jgi:hypothetical protein